MPSLKITLKEHLSRPLTLRLLAKEIGVGEDQVYKMANDEITSLNKFTLGKMIAFMRANGHPDFDVADLLKYVPD